MSEPMITEAKGAFYLREQPDSIESSIQQARVLTARIARNELIHGKMFRYTA